MKDRRPSVIVMLKEPQAGRVKTRLGKDIGMSRAAWWFRHQVQALLRRIEDPRWRLILAVSPDHRGMKSRVWPAHLPRIPQGGGNLGARMARAMQQMPFGPTCVIGADIPGIGKTQIQSAFERLNNHDAVFGPAPDGGYWLVGFANQRLVKGAFDDVRWSTQYALHDTRANLQGLRIGIIEELQDIDTIDDFKMT